MQQPDFTLHYGQPRLINDRSKSEHAIVAGLGYGKTLCGARWLVKRCIDNLQSSEFLVIAPDFRLVKNRCLAEFESLLISMGMKEGRNGHYRIYRSTNELKVVFRWGPKPWGQTVYFLGAENPAKIVSYNTAAVWLDEPALMNEEVPKKVIQRNRCPHAVYRQRFYSGTPEGLNWFYDRFGPDGRFPCVRIEGTPYSESATKLVLHGRSHDNAYAPQEWLDELDREFGWDSKYYANYVLGEWVSLSRSSFYFNFDPRVHVGDYPARPAIKDLILTWDNNVGQMTWVAMQPFQGTYLAVKDNDGRGRNIDDCCEQFIDAFPPEVWRDHNLTILGDPAIWQRTTHSADRGFDLIWENLKKHYPRASVQARDAQPTIEARNRTTNRILGERRLLVDKKCKKLIASAKGAEFDGKGKVKKGSGDTVTHAMEAVDMALVVLEPPKITREYHGIK